MDANHFDALTRCLTSGGPRRRVLRLLAATPVVGGALALLPGDALAKDPDGGVFSMMSFVEKHPGMQKKMSAFTTAMASSSVGKKKAG